MGRPTDGPHDPPFATDGWRFLQSLSMGGSSERSIERGEIARHTYILRDFGDEVIPTCPRHLVTPYASAWLALWWSHRKSDFLPHDQRTQMHTAVMRALDNERGLHELAEMEAREVMRG